MNQPVVEAFFDSSSNTISYCVSDPQTRDCAIIDAVLHFDPASGRTSNVSLDPVVSYVRNNDLNLVWILETHAHADHISGAPVIKEMLGGQIGIGGGIQDVRSAFRRLFDIEPSVTAQGEQFDRFLVEGDELLIGELSLRVIETPGHTPSCVTYVIDDAAFVGDTLFMPDGGTARADFPGGDARLLYQSIQKILSLPENTRIFVCHDYGPGGREVAWQTTVQIQNAENIHVGNGRSESEFVEMRETRDATLSLPSLIVPAIQLNVRAGYLPEAERNGISYIRIPINQL